MINYKQAKKDFEEIRLIVANSKNFEELTQKLEKEKTFDITNDFRNDNFDKFIDFNYKSLCVTVYSKNDKLCLSDYVEIWSDDLSLVYVSKDISEL